MGKYINVLEDISPSEIIILDEDYEIILVTHEDILNCPYISIEPGSIHDEFRFRVSFESSHTVDLKTYEDCFNNIYKSLEWKFKRDEGKYGNTQCLRNLKLITLLK